MAPVTLEHTEGGPLTLDVCRGCDGLWFDAGEQFRLTADTTLRLIKEVQDHRGARRSQTLVRCPCPRCGLPLGSTYDLVRDVRYQYWRCPDRHGVLFGYFDFLRSQGLVRGLTDVEMAELKAHAATVNCANCGAPVAVGKDAVCAHCGAPLSMIDMNYLGRALKQMQVDAATPAASAPLPAAWPDPDRLLDNEAASSPYRMVGGGTAVNLLEAGLSILMALLR